MQELFPIAAGLLAGAFLTLVRPTLRPPLGLVAAVVIGFLATVLSGEFRIGWEFLIIDIPGAALAVFAGNALTQRLRRAPRPPAMRRRPRGS
jgi:CHASE2 domain-containing sensor protein